MEMRFWRTWAFLPMASLVAAHTASLLGWICSQPAAFLSRHCMFMASLLPGISSILLDSFPVSCTAFSGVSCLDSQAFLWNLGGNFPDITILTFCMSVKSESYGQCQAASLGSSSSLWNCACSGFYSWMGEHNEMNPEETSFLPEQVSQGFSFQMKCAYFCTFEHEIGRVCWFLRNF